MTYKVNLQFFVFCNNFISIKKKQGRTRDDSVAYSIDKSASIC